ncbi:MAG: carboxylating nicotinate-nucleotide diphosphorylase [Cyclobacteriaceae bacterium]|nr:carboxylating nicotinate-nucleotide diphosphorylase [Cyclobacteriaceae bacterium]
MLLPYLTDAALEQFVRLALAEDIGEGDHSTLGAVPPTTIGHAVLLVKDTGILAGVAVAKKVAEAVDATLQIQLLKQDGDPITRGDIAFTVTGKAQSILMAERLILNCMQRMSGIATYTHTLCKIIEGTSARIMDTRKTTPNFRMLEKWAVAIGGGLNHRFALYDMVMLKDNHVDLAGGVQPAIEHVTAYLRAKHKTLKIEIETRTLAEVEEVLRVGGVDVIMLDNMSLTDMKQAVALIGGRYKTEASGGITEATLRSVAECGVDYISVGALTHSVKSLDLSLKISVVP